MLLSRPPGRRRATWAVATLAAATLLASPLTAAADSDGTLADSPKVDSALASAVADGEEATFFVVLKNQADLSAAEKETTHEARAEAAYDELVEHAEATQESLTTYLDRQKVGHEDFWIANAVQVTGDADLVETLSQRSDVAEVVKEQQYTLDATESTLVGDVTDVNAATTAAPEWGIADINADDVWSGGNTGEGIVIANIDSGVQYDHPDLVGSYRGNNGDGTFTHDYNFYDPTGTCTDGPCDNNGHGTHTMGTMVGANGIGVAPGATWIAAKGCEAKSCSDSSLLKAGQWVMAPTDANGNNPRPDLAPNIVNNSWGGGFTTFYQDIVEAWNAVGIFEAFAAGNSGDGVTCSTTEAPGAQAPVYGVGAYDVNGTIANFSGFGPSRVDGSSKPNIAAPGVNVRSTWPGSTYSAINGTSMATPHVAGAVALLWAASPALIGDIEGTRAILDGGARDVDDTHCGGTADRNNVWGEGKLDVLASVQAAPKGVAHLTGTVTAKTGGAPIQGVTVTATNADGSSRTVQTALDGTYHLNVVPGTYDVSVSKYGFVGRAFAGMDLADGSSTTRNAKLVTAAAHPVSGTVLDVVGAPLGGAEVRIEGSPLDAVTTAANGTFSVPSVAVGDYTLVVTPAAPVLCNGDSATTLTVDGAESRVVRLPALTDTYGNSCEPVAYSWVKGTDAVALSGDEDAARVSLPFWVSLYGADYSSASVTTNGLVNMMSSRLGDFENTAMPGTAAPNGVIAPFWDDLTLDRKSSVQTATKGKTGNRTFAIVWNKAVVADSGDRVTFEVLFHEATGDITFQYQSVPGAGAGATVGIENQIGTDALQYSFDQAVLTDGSAIRITPGA